MNGKWFAVAMVMVMAGASAGCGEGRLIFNVDAFSWLGQSANDSIQYNMPIPGTVTPPTSAQEVTLVPGLGSSGIDTVKVTGSARVTNQSGGPGTLRLQVYLADDSAGTYTAGRDSLFRPAPSATITAGADTVLLPLNVDNLSPSGNALFNKSTVWIRLEATVANNGIGAMQGKVVLTSLNLRIVVQDKFF